MRGTRLVLITLDMPEDYVRRLFAAFTNQPSIAPDRAALEDNPLAIAGRVSLIAPSRGRDDLAEQARVRCGEAWRTGGSHRVGFTPHVSKRSAPSARRPPLSPSATSPPRGGRLLPLSRRLARREAVAACIAPSFDQPVAALGAEGGNIDDGERVGGFEPQPAARLHCGQPLSRLEHGQRAVQALEVVDGGGLVERPQLPKILLIAHAPQPPSSAEQLLRGLVVRLSSAAAACGRARHRRRRDRRGSGGASAAAGLLLGQRCPGVGSSASAEPWPPLSALAASSRQAFPRPVFLAAFSASSAAILRPAGESMRPMRAVTVTVPSAFSDGGSIGTRSPRARLLRPLGNELGFLDAGDRRLGRRHAGLAPRR